MKLSDIADGSVVFVDANIFVYSFGPHPVIGQACVDFLERIERCQLKAVTSSLVLNDTAHRLMSIEACSAFQWKYSGIVTKMNRHPVEVAQLHQYQQAVENIIKIGIQIVPVTEASIIGAIQVSRSSGLLMNDSILIHEIQRNGINHLASNDGDFDRVPNIIRYHP